MTAFEEFQKEEYGKIADAHFKTTESISAFFRYYLILMALPLSIVGALVTFATRSTGPQEEIAKLFLGAKPWTGIVFVIVGLIGFSIMAYMAELRFDALLYARTVNAIRKFFYDRAEEGFLQLIRMRRLPQNAFEPNYFEPAFFLPVVIVFALFNTIYFCFGLAFVFDQSRHFFPAFEILTSPPYYIAIASFVFGTCHIALYRRRAVARETRYLQRGSIGIDIDGVLNRHRHHFASTLATVGGPSIDPDAITTLPVHHTPELGVEQEFEVKVFNSPEYWLDMPPAEKAGYYVSAIRNLGLEIHIVSNRPWPLLRGEDKEIDRHLEDKWLSITQEILSKRPRLEHFVSILRYCIFRTGPAIEVITQDWLRRQGIPFDSLTIERGIGKAGLHQPRATANRVQLSHKHRLKFFVEDDWEAAYRLAFICDVVFLVKQPYNEQIARTKDPFGKSTYTEALPGNVVKVEGWRDIYEAIKRLS